MRVSPSTLGIAIMISVVIVNSSGATISTDTIGVSATVTSSCVVASSPLAFGNYSGTALAKTAALTVLCTNGTPYTVALDNGTGAGATAALREMSGPGGQTLSYNVYSDAAHTVSFASTSGVNTVSGTGSGSAQTIQAYGQIPAAQSPSAGTYTDTITVTLTY